MANQLTGCSVQYWLESAAQGYLLGTEHGHLPGQNEPEALLTDERLREEAIRVTVQLVLFERSSLLAASALVRLAPDDASRCFLATQTVDEARHVEIFRRRLLDLGVRRRELEDVIRSHANPHLVQIGELLQEKVDAGDFLVGVAGQNVILEGMAGPVFELLHATHEGVNPKFAHTLAGVLADENRHSFFGEQRVREMIRRHPGRRGELTQLQLQVADAMLETFAFAFRSAPRSQERSRLRQELARRAGGCSEPQPLWQGEEVDSLEPEEIERRLTQAVLEEWRQRCERIGLEYQAPRRT